MTKLSFSPRKLYEGCLQAAITHAVAVGLYPEFNYEHSWDELSYSTNNSQGCRGTITFHEKYIIAAFRDDQIGNSPSDAMVFFKDAPEELIQLAQTETLLYLLLNVDGEVKPVITAAFWGTWEQLYTHQSVTDLCEDGGYIIGNALQTYEDAANEWRDYYELDDAQIALIDSLFQRKLHAGNQPVYLTEKDLEVLYGDVNECLVSLGELGIRLP
ncbi:MAG: hypothetical protein J6R82_07385 [Clostridia bacterium]|nr:hypothetical protein [Clostridia bacterium]